MTGGDPIRARDLYTREFTFSPHFKVSLASNFKPVIRDTSVAMWDRVRLIPFDVYFADAQRDKDLEAKLRAELPGILNWAVEGCLDWQRNGLQDPTIVTGATDEYRRESDSVTQFLLDCTIQDSTSNSTTPTVGATELYGAYSRWCETAWGEKPLPQRMFGQEMTRRGYKRSKGRVGVTYVGVGLAVSAGEPDLCEPCEDAENRRRR